MLEKCCIVSVGIGLWYPRGIDRLARSLRDVRWRGNTLFYRNEYPEMCPPVVTNGYAFKPYAIEFAVELGFRYLLWLDASIWAVRPVDSIFRMIAEKGALFFHNGYSTGEWCRDSSLSTLKINREEIAKIPEVTTAIFGLDMEASKSKEFLSRWKAYAHDGETFVIHPRENKNGECSADPRVKGHRYDQTAASVLVHRLEIERNHSTGIYSYHYNRTPEVIFVNRGL